MICASSILEVRYNPILDFSLKSRELLAPYSKLASNVNITNEGILSETIRFDFQDDLFFIYFAYNIAALWSDTNTQVLVNSDNSPIKIFFDILDKIKSLPSFGSITNHLMQCDYLVPKDLKKDLGIEFEEIFLKKSNIFNLNNPNNYEIVLTNKVDNQEEEILLRTYKPDLFHPRKNNFFQVDRFAIYNEDLDNAYHYGYKLYEVNSKIDFKKFKMTQKRAIEIYQKLGI
jgi:hypothetical protein